MWRFRSGVEGSGSSACAPTAGVLARPSRSAPMSPSARKLSTKRYALRNSAPPKKAVRPSTTPAAPKWCRHVAHSPDSASMHVKSRLNCPGHASLVMSPKNTGSRSRPWLATTTPELARWRLARSLASSSTPASSSTVLTSMHPRLALPRAGRLRWRSKKNSSASSGVFSARAVSNTRCVRSANRSMQVTNKALLQPNAA